MKEHEAGSRGSNEDDAEVDRTRLSGPWRDGPLSPA